MTKRTAVVRSGLRYKRRTQVLSRGGYVPRYSGTIVEAGGKKTAHRYVRRRYKEGRREKVFKFKLTRGDGTLITKAGGLLSYIRLYNSDNNRLSITTPEYNTKTEYWSFNLADSADKDKDGYWVDYLCEDGIGTQYPYRYKNADKDQDADLIKVGTYEDTIPYWKISYTGIPGYVGCTGDNLTTNFISGVARNGSYAFLNGGIYTKKTNIKSSVPYRVAWGTRDNSIRTKRAHERYHTLEMHWYSGECVIWEPWPPTMHPVGERCCRSCVPFSTCSLRNTSGGPFTLIANGINLTITDDPIPIETDIAEFSGSIEGADHIATLSGGAPPADISVCTEGYFPLYYPTHTMCGPLCENVGDKPYSYTHWYPGVYDCVTISATYDY